ncbi:MAG: hypothetical protein CL578_06100 [Alteromonadaceae bacterium]|uniref:hypothetical protein n=1 Tax=uncultured Paraglaciecola sp. TaxID=1765024 RepID=UPI000C5B21F4|nr:hypothetical protein [Alteromonadaceae bacterium]|tara:strand:- start:49971 stop:50708 length:738 start_codon:yes stop_codon:yes gene_type:complete
MSASTGSLPEEQAETSLGDQISKKCQNISNEKLKSIVDLSDGDELTPSQLSVFSYWGEMNKQRYINTSYHIHFALDKVHDTMKLYIKIFTTMCIFIGALYSGKLTHIFSTDLVERSLLFLGLVILGVTGFFIAHIVFWTQKWKHFRKLEYDLFKDILHQYESPTWYQNIYGILTCGTVVLLNLGLCVSVLFFVNLGETDKEIRSCVETYSMCSQNEGECRESLSQCVIPKSDTPVATLQHEEVEL